MSTPARRRPTIALLMGVIAGVALILSNQSGRIGAIVRFVALPTALAIASASLVLHYATSPALGMGCPYCGRAELERRSVSSFGRRFYRCAHCGVRCMRVALGGWEDASDPRFDRRYASRAEQDPWTGPPSLDDEDLVASKTHQALIRSKRARSPENPNGPGLE